MLPRVTRWSLLNEPNQPGWLTPQYERRRGRLVATAAVVYRALARAGIAGLRASGHGRDQVLLGETAPIGRTSGSLARRPIPPVEFLRKLFCLTPAAAPARRRRARARLPEVQALRGRRLRAPPLPARRLAAAGRAARRRRARSRSPSPSRLRRVLDAAARARRIPRRLPVYYTEFGFQTNPPDRIFGVRAALQPAYLNQSDWMAYRDRRVRAVAQYKLVDEAPLPSFQSGLRFVDGRAEAGLRRLPAADLGQRARLAAAGLRAGAPGARTGRRRPCGSRCGRRAAARSRRSGRVTVRSRRGPVPRARAAAPRRLAAGLGLAGLPRGAGSRRDDRLPRVLHRGLLPPRPRRGRADGPLAGAGRALEGRPRRAAVRAGGAAAGLAGGDRLRRRRAAGRARRARAGAGARRLRALAARGGASRGRAASRGRVEVFDGAGRAGARTAPTTSRSSRTCSSTSPSR